MKKLITLTMTFILAVTCLFSVPVSAAEEQVQPHASLYFNSYLATVVSEGGGDISVTMTVKAKTVVQELGVKKVIIQEKSGSDWIDVATFTSSTNPELMGKNVLAYGTSVAHSGTKGKSYRAKVTFYAKDASGSDTKTLTSSSKTA